MAEVQATLVTSIGGVMPTDDGGHALLKLGLTGGEITLAVGRAHLRELLECVTNGVALTSSKAKMPPEVLAFQVAWWTIGRTPDGQLAVSFRLGNGAELSFVLGADQIAPIRETLQTMEGAQSTPPTPDKLKN